MFDNDDNWSDHGHGWGNWGGSGRTRGGRLFMAGFGVLWTIFAIALTGAMPDWGPFAVAKYVFPAFGVLFILSALLGGRTHKPPQGTGKAEGTSAPPDSGPARSGDSPPQREMKLVCARCGATPTNPSVSPHGDVKCQYCGTWYNVYRQSD